MDPFTAKSISEILKKNIKNYEKKFGKIDKPNALKKIEKESKSAKKGKKIAPNYFG